MNQAEPSLSRRILRLPAEILVALYVVLDALIAPLFRPIMRGLSRLQLVQRLERGIHLLPPYVILVLLFVPFGVAELAKVYALLLMAEEHVRTGVTIFIGAYIVSILVCERIFHAGRDRLMEIGWFRRLFDWVMAIKARILAWFHKTAVWRMVEDLRARGRMLVVRIRTSIGLRPPDTFERP